MSALKRRNLILIAVVLVLAIVARVLAAVPAPSAASGQALPSDNLIINPWFRLDNDPMAPGWQMPSKAAWLSNDNARAVWLPNVPTPDGMPSGAAVRIHGEGSGLLRVVDGRAGAHDLAFSAYYSATAALETFTVQVYGYDGLGPPHLVWDAWDNAAASPGWVNTGLLETDVLLDWEHYEVWLLAVCTTNAVCIEITGVYFAMRGGTVYLPVVYGK